MVCSGGSDDGGGGDGDGSGGGQMWSANSSERNGKRERK